MAEGIDIAETARMFTKLQIPESNGGARPKTRRSPKDRSKTSGKRGQQPYDKTDIPFGALAESALSRSLEELNISPEKCDRDQCTCKVSPSSSSSNEAFRMPRVCRRETSSSRKILREARLKLHHSVKDHKGVLREARLKYIKFKQTPYRKNLPTTLTNTPLKMGSLRKSLPVKGRTLTDFASLAKNHEDSDDEAALAFPPRPAHQRSRNPLPNVAVPGLDNASGSEACSMHNIPCSCAQQALMDDCTMDELACYFEDYVHIPKKMSPMAEMMYT